MAAQTHGMAGNPGGRRRNKGELSKREILGFPSGQGAGLPIPRGGF